MYENENNEVRQENIENVEQNKKQNPEKIWSFSGFTSLRLPPLKWEGICFNLSPVKINIIKILQQPQRILTNTDFSFFQFNFLRLLSSLEKSSENKKIKIKKIEA